MTRNRALFVGATADARSHCAFCLGLSVWADRWLRPTVPAHWDLAGHPDGYSSRVFLTSLVPAIVGFVWLLMLLLPAISRADFALRTAILTVAVVAIVVILPIAYSYEVYRRVEGFGSKS